MMNRTHIALSVLGIAAVRSHAALAVAQRERTGKIFLNRHRPIKRIVDGFVDDRKAARTNHRHNRLVTNLRAGGQCVRAQI